MLEKPHCAATYVGKSGLHQHLCLGYHLHALLWVLCPQFFLWLPFNTQTHLRQGFAQRTGNHLDLCRSNDRHLTIQHSYMSTDLPVRMILAGVTQLKCESLFRVSPSAMSPLLGFRACFYLRRFLSRCLSTVRKSRVRETEREKNNTCLRLHVTPSGVFQSLPVTPHRLPLLCSQQNLWEHLCINFLLDYRSRAQDNLA